MVERLPVRDALKSFAPGESLRAALFLTYSFDGRWFEEALVPDLYERPIGTMLVVRDRNAISSEAPSVRYRKANAASSRVFHPKLALLVSEHRARAIISSANLTRGGFERQSELGRVYDLGPDSSPGDGIFTGLADYLAKGVSTEVKGDSARALTEITAALREVVAKHERPRAASSHALLHNYVQSIWSQILERVPHRLLRRAVVVSPFFEPDRKHPEDPALGPDDASVFRRMLFDDFEFEAPKGEPPVSVYFRQSEGRTELPVRKLRDLASKVAFFAQDERQQRLHAKLLILEGAEGKGREPFLVAVHGSPNFTTAGLLNRPPHGNSELAVFTTLPVRRKGLSQSVSVLGLDRGFTRVENLAALSPIEEAGDAPAALTQGVADATFCVLSQTLRVSLLEPTPESGSVRVMMERHGAWTVVGEAPASSLGEIDVPVTGVMELDPRTKFQELRGTRVRIEVLNAEGGVISSNESPINVDIPSEFVGLTLVGTAHLSLDERIARAGLGVLPSYREQQKWLEARKAGGSAAAGPAVSLHQADLDRFFRNVHNGLRGILARGKAAPSQYTAQRSLDELTRWAVEATTSDDVALTRECRLYLVGRLLRVLSAVVDGVGPKLTDRVAGMGSRIGVHQKVAQVAAWLHTIDQPALLEYARESRKQAKGLLSTFNSGKDPVNAA